MPESDDHPKIPAAVQAPSLPEFEYDSLNKGDRIGAGGDAGVYYATIEFNREIYSVAVKEPRFEGTLHQQVLERFENEAETWSKLDDHDNIVTVYSWGTTPLPWLALEYMDGGTLAEKIGTIDIAEALWLSGRIAEGIRYGHRHGIAHLDIKPSNILLRETDAGTWDYPKVSDWGLAKFLLGHSQSVEGLSPTYAAPEQFDPDTYGRPDDITDIYQFGTVVYALCAGESPFTGSATSVMQDVLTETPTPPSEHNPKISNDLDNIILKSLSKNKEFRYESIVLLRKQLDKQFNEYANIEEFDSLRGISAPSAPSTDTSQSPPEQISRRDKKESSTTENTSDGRLSRRGILSILGASTAGVGAIVLSQLDIRDKETTPNTSTSSDGSSSTINTSSDRGSSTTNTSSTGGGSNPQVNSDLHDFSALSNWPMVNHDAMNSGWNPEFRDPEFDGSQVSKRWQYETGGQVTAPVIVDDYVCVGSRDNKVHAITAGTGDDHWTFQSPGLIRNPVAIQNGEVIAAPRGGDVVGLNIQRGDSNKFFGDDGSPPIASGGKVYYTSHADGGGTYCYSQEGADKLWGTETNPYTLRPPAVGENSIFVSGDDGEIYSIDKSSGNVAWQVKTEGEFNSGQQLETPVISESTVFVGRSGEGKGMLHAFNRQNGKKNWEHTVTEDSGDQVDRPLDVRQYVCNDDSIFFASKFELSKVDKDTGEFQWSTDVKSVITDLALSTDWIYATLFNRGIYRIDPETGKESQVVEDSSSSPKPFTSISLANRQLFVSDGKYVMSFSEL